MSSEEPTPGEEMRIRVDSTAPNRLAEEMLSRLYFGGDHVLLRRYREQWWRYDGAWRLAEPEEQPAAVRGFLDLIDYPDINRKGEWTGGYKRLRVTKSIVSETLDAAIRDHTMQYSTLVTGDQPRWLSERTTPAANRVIAFRNGLLDVDEWVKGNVVLLPLTPEWFGPNVLPFDFDSNAYTPELWYDFLSQIWPDDIQQAQLLQEWFGYCLTHDTSHQKALLVIGPPRSGKGTIARLLRHLVGQHNTAAPTLASLGTQYGFWSLLGKQVAVVGDARLSGRSDQAIVVERILSITGEDGVDIERKFLGPLTSVRLPTRLMLLTNELPRLMDSSGALASRFMILQMHETFLGREDLNLEAKLLQEAPAIILWALMGLRNLHARGRFVQPRSSVETVEELEDLSSPVKAFARDHCDLGPDSQTSVPELYDAWCWWCDEVGREPGTSQVFSRDLKAAYPQIKTRQLRIQETRHRVYDGIRVKLASAEAARGWKSSGTRTRTHA